MELLSALETLSTVTCAGALIIWMSIGSLSRSERSEEFAQRLMVLFCFNQVGDGYGLIWPRLFDTLLGSLIAAAASP